MFRWRIGVGWWLVVLTGLPVLTLAFAVALGDTFKPVDLVPFVATQVAGLLVNLVLINIIEETGWAGLVQTRLQRNHGLVVAAALTAVPFALVHMPLHFIGDFSLDSLTTALVTLLIVCVIVRILLGGVLSGTGGSIFAVALTHTMFNRSNNEEGIIAGLVDGDGRKLAGLLAVIVLGVIVSAVNRRVARTAAPTARRHSQPHPETGSAPKEALMNTAPNPPPTPGAHPGRVHDDRIRAIAARGRRAMRRSPGSPSRSRTPTGVLYTGAIGYADLASRRAATPEDQYLWFSMTKIATATTAMRLHADGVLDLDAPIGSYLPGYRPHPTHGHPTTRQLLTHTAGLGNPMPVRWVRPEHQPADPATARAHRRQARHPAQTRRWAGVVLQHRLPPGWRRHQAATGRSVEECVHDLVLAPLGMDATGYALRP